MVRFALFSVALFFMAYGSGWSAMANYDVVKRGNPGINIDGVVNEATWESIPAISGTFSYPWEKVEAPKTVFKAFHDGTTFYFSFVCVDPEVVVEKEAKGERATVDPEDRVELFFAPAPIDYPEEYKLPTYYAVEVDPVGRVHDYSMVYYRNIDSDWNMPGFKSAGKLTPDGYAVEGSIPLATLRELDLLKEDGFMQTGVYRAEFYRKGNDIDMHWISWIDPQTPVPDYHVNDSFGLFTFLE